MEITKKKFFLEDLITRQQNMSEETARKVDQKLKKLWIQVMREQKST